MPSSLPGCRIAMQWIVAWYGGLQATPHSFSTNKGSETKEWESIICCLCLREDAWTARQANQAPNIALGPQQNPVEILHIPDCSPPGTPYHSLHHPSPPRHPQTLHASHLLWMSTCCLQPWLLWALQGHCSKPGMPAVVRLLVSLDSWIPILESTRK